MRKPYAFTLIFMIISPAFSIGILTTPLYANSDIGEEQTNNNGVTKWTIMVYLDADNNLDTYGVLNLQQIYAGLNPGANVNVVVLLDRLNEEAWLYDIKNRTNESLGELDMGSWETLRDFVVNVTSNFKSDYYMLILWDHGLGWPGICWDDTNSNSTYQSYISPTNLTKALTEAYEQTGKKVNIVGFDACLMGMIEICYELKNVTDIVIGSEMLIPGYGWPYKEFTEYISNNPQVDPKTLSEAIVTQYVEYYSRIKPNFLVQLSAIDTSKIDEMSLNLNETSAYLAGNVESMRGLITGARSASQQKFILGTMGVIFYVDLYKFADLLQKRTDDPILRDLASNLTKSIDDMVFAENHTRPQGNLDEKQFGLTVYFPANRQTFIFKYPDYVPNFAVDTGWYNFLRAYCRIS
jgi:hypothetical protein